jgi:hypothetical protein
MSLQTDTRCPHGRDRSISPESRQDDYNPLSFEELRELLEAASVGNWQDRARIQMRLTRAIPGMTCPRPTNGPAARKISLIDELYVSTPREKLPAKALDFWEIISAA